MNNRAVPSPGYTVPVIIFYAGCVSAGLVKSYHSLFGDLLFNAERPDNVP